MQLSDWHAPSEGPKTFILLKGYALVTSFWASGLLLYDFMPKAPPRLFQESDAGK